MTAVAGAMGALGVVSHAVPNGDSTGSLVVLIGLAVGVDYSLFYVRREREERRRGHSPERSLELASASVGRAIIVAGTTVMVALAGLFLSGIATFASMAAGTILVVAIAVLGSLTVLPAMLALLGDRIDAGRVLGRRRARRARLARAGAPQPDRRARPSTIARFVHAVARRPVGALAVALALLLALAAPALHMRLGQGGTASLPEGIPAIEALAEIDASFGGSSEADLVVTGRALDSAAARAGLQRLIAAAARSTGAAGFAPVEISRDAATALVRIPMPDQEPAAAQQTVKRLRTDLAGPGADLVPGADRVLVGGDAAEGLDFRDTVVGAMPPVVLFVLGLALVLLLLAFRSLPLALVVIGLNLLSVGAAYGVMTEVFQHTWAEGLLDFTSNGAVTTWMPLLAFVILFGLSMDYSILVLERIREARAVGRSPREAAAEGVAATAGTVTGAAGRDGGRVLDLRDPPPARDEAARRRPRDGGPRRRHARPSDRPAGRGGAARRPRVPGRGAPRRNGGACGRDEPARGASASPFEAPARSARMAAWMRTRRS
ncbi:MAG: MMPL family transporter [Patulibacter minatonensis]